MIKLLLLTIAVAAIAVGVGLMVTFNMLNEVPDLPLLPADTWWGNGPKPIAEDTSVRPFRIDFNDTMINDLKQRIKHRRPLTKTLQGMQAQYGINIDYLERTLKYWHDEYDFKKREEMLNQFEHYKTRIQGLDIHFVRQKPKEVGTKEILPLLLLHGWPSSSKEYQKIIPMLTTTRKDFDFVFDVVAADLPGFGFSEGSNKPGLSPVQIGIMMRNLMHRLGFKKFYIQAGDWGSQCASHLVTLYPDEVFGFHSNMPLSSVPISSLKIILGALYPPLVVDAKYQDRIYPLKKLLTYIIRESGYFHLQSTKPDTVGVGLTDSPSGLAAYIMEKMAACTNRDQLDTPHGGLAGLDIDDVLDTIMITWVNNCIVTSMRIYSEGISSASTEVNTLQKIPTYVPFAAINFKYEVLYQPDGVLRGKFPNLVHSTTLDFGGHFAALESPQVLADDLFKATVAFRKFQGSA